MENMFRRLLGGGGAVKRKRITTVKGAPQNEIFSSVDSIPRRKKMSVICGCEKFQDLSGVHVDLHRECLIS